MELILASGSKRRRDLMKAMGYDFAVIKSDADESSVTETDPARLVEELSLLKARAVWESLPDGLKENAAVLGSDTVVELSGRILGKPRDKEDAAGMLRELSGRTNAVHTGVALIVPDGKGGSVERVVSDCAVVSVSELDEDEITAYVDSGEPMDKAGAYGIQGPFALFSDRVDGSFFTAVGLPVHLVYRMLKAVGITPHF